MTMIDAKLRACEKCGNRSAALRFRRLDSTVLLHSLSP